MKRNSIKWLAIALASAALAAHAQYPNKPIKMVVPFPAGGTTDILARAVAADLQKVFGQPVFVENKAGAGGNIGSDSVAKSPPDGYTLLMGTVGTHAINVALYPKMPYDAVKDFTPISLVARSPAFLVASMQFEPTTAQETIAFAKAQPDKLTMAIAGTGSVVVDLFRGRSGLKFVSVPYKGSSPALLDLISGQVNVMITTMASAGPHVKAGKLRVLAATGDKRSAEFPDVPTFTEVGVPGMDYEQWFGIMGPANLPRPVVDKLGAAMAQILQMRDVRERLVGMALDVAAPGPDEMKRKVEADAARWTKLAQELKLEPLD